MKAVVYREEQLFTKQEAEDHNLILEEVGIEALAQLGFTLIEAEGNA